MINYVNNSFDKVLKPCDAQRFHTLTTCEQTERLILGHRAGEPKAKGKLPAITYMGVLDEPRYKAYLVQCEEQGTKPLGSRRAEFMRPTGLLMLDFDHVGRSPLPAPPEGGEPQPSRIDSPMKLWEYIQEKYSAMSESSPSGGVEGACLPEMSESPLLGRGMGEACLPAMSESSPSGGVEGACLPLALAHITPSGDGLRVVVKRPVGMTIEQAQYEWCQAMEFDKVGIKCDNVCKDISRLSFAPMKSEVLYYNPSLLFMELPEASDYPDGSLWGGDSLRATLGTPPSPCDTPSMNRGGVGEASTHPEGMQSTNCPSVYRGTSTKCGGSSKQSAEQPAMSASSPSGGVEGAFGVPVVVPNPATFDTDYNGVPYAEIVKRLEEQLGGRPEHGARNSFIFTMACNLRYICNDNAAWVASILPTYGEEPQKHRMTIQSAINRPMSRTMPETMARALRISKTAMGEKADIRNNKSELAFPAMPTALPEPLAMLISRTPQPMRPAVAMAVFPPLGTHLHEVRFHYWDNRDYEPTFMNVLVAELSSGKSAVNTPIEYIIADIEARDEVAREREREWKSQCATISNAKDKPQRPKGLAIQCLSADMTNAAFVQRLADAEGRFLYTMMDEIELLDSLKTNTRGGSVSAVLRLAFDCGKYGQERVASNAVNAKVRVRWNWNASTTVQRVRKYFAHSIADGTLSRLSFSTILKDDEDWGDTHRPIYGDYGQAFADTLRPYIDALSACKGTLRCPEAEQWALHLSDDLVDFARQLDDRSYATMSFRAVLMGFFRAMVLYVMNGCRWTSVIADFAAWTVRYDLWCKMRFFRDMLHKDMEGEQTALQRGPVSLLTLLPMEFTRQQAEELRVAQGMKPNPVAMLSTWKKRGYVTLDEQRGVYVQTKAKSTVNS